MVYVDHMDLTKHKFPVVKRPKHKPVECGISCFVMVGCSIECLTSLAHIFYYNWHVKWALHLLIVYQFKGEGGGAKGGNCPPGYFVLPLGYFVPPLGSHRGLILCSRNEITLTI